MERDEDLRIKVIYALIAKGESYIKSGRTISILRLFWMKYLIKLKKLLWLERHGIMKSN